MNKTIGILAHVDAGKTTFSEQLLFYTKSIKQRGRVDHQNSFLDNHDIEKQRGITVFAEQANFQYNDNRYTLIDTPGHVDFSPEMERAIAVLDAAIIVVSAVEGVEAHTETVWQLLRKHRIPTFFFINKIDRTGASVDRVVKQLQQELSNDIVYIEAADSGLQWSETLIEQIAERDEGLLDTYMEHGFEQQRWLEVMQQLVMTGDLYPSFAGSALHDIGVESFLKAFDRLTVTAYDADLPLTGRVYRLRYDQNSTRITFVKLLSGKLSVRDELSYGDHFKDKVTQIRRYNGMQFEAVSTAYAGELVAVIGLAEARIGDGIGELTERFEYELQPTLRSKIVFEQQINPKEALKYFRMLEAEDPSLHVEWEEKHGDIQLHVMGKIQLEVLKQIADDRFGLLVHFASPEILYKETIAEEVIGYGHFEPLRHYAEVHLRLEPAKRGEGVSYASICHVDELSDSLQRLVGQHVLEREHHGLLTGSPLTDVKVTLLRGRDHNKHTHGGDFREATLRAIRQGLEKAQNVLLEPYYQFKIIVQSEQIGRVISDIQRANGELDPLITEGERAVVTGRAPVATILDYPSELASFTQGKGKIHLSFGDYAPCHNTSEVIERIGYNKDADPEYTSSSIFCAKGAGYSVQWQEAEQMMHIEIQKARL
ncbi:translation factor GTPase family protein [Paenibacillus sp. FSL W7-1287]|uniref:translation factor GTPase family protein n=1 Tax=Paenibacillus sp. FSL W7-1287 TaxID=2954538 RepID=UPI0030FADFF2